MSRITLNRSSLLALALGLTALGSTTIPAAALGGLGRAPISSSVGASHPSGGFAGAAAAFQNALPAKNTAGHTILGNRTDPVHAVGTAPSNTSAIGRVTPGNLKEPGNVIKPVPLPKVIGMRVIGVVVKPGNGGSTVTPVKNGGVDNVCPFNKFKCPPQGQNGPGATPGSDPSMPGGTGPVVNGLPPAPVVVPPVVTNAPPVMPPAVGGVGSVPGTPAAADAPCGCLTKQYLDDGSVLFRDICTKEAAVATAAELKAQAAAR